MFLIETHNVSKIYRIGKREVAALNGISLQIRKGSFLIIKGRSGSGKTTLLNLIGCLDRPTKGKILMNGLEVSKLPERELPIIRRKNIGFIFQHFHLLPTLNALDNVMLPLKYDGVPRSEAIKRATELLEHVNMGQRLRHRPKELSGGEQQRVAIARALVNYPSIVLADEPTGDLDSKTAISVFELIKELNNTIGQTFLIVTHDDLISDYAERKIQLQDGIIQSDTQDEAFS
ncbi:MAG: ABC transporter ATP-binding protein [Desulfobacterales bacterium]|jgi:putative ABC transport system ATP-binding protein